MGRDSRKRKRSPDAAQEETSLRRSNRLRASNPHSTLHSPQPTRSVEPTESEGLDTATLVESQGSPYAMEMVLAPPRRIAVGETFGAPLVVTVSARRRRGRRASETQQISDLNGIWAFLSLITADGKESLAPPRHDLLKGNITDTIHPLSTVPQTDEDPFAYVTFPGLRINEPGRYRFKVNLIDTTRIIQEDGSTAAARVLHILHSDVFDVVEDAAESRQQDNRIEETISRLKNMGVDI